LGSRGYEQNTSLNEYVARMKDEQEDIYYLLAPSLAAAKSSPHLEAFRTKGVEVLLLGEGVDNWVVSSLREFDGKKRLNSLLTALTDGAEEQTS
jgi:molecular chaperone HtpG